jgi:hypothetical protein
LIQLESTGGLRQTPSQKYVDVEEYDSGHALCGTTARAIVSGFAACGFVRLRIHFPSTHNRGHTSASIWRFLGK